MSSMTSGQIIPTEIKTSSLYSRTSLRITMGTQCIGMSSKIPAHGYHLRRKYTEVYIRLDFEGELESALAPCKLSSAFIHLSIALVQYVIPIFIFFLAALTGDVFVSKDWQRKQCGCGCTDRLPSAFLVEAIHYLAGYRRRLGKAIQLSIYYLRISIRG